MKVVIPESLNDITLGQFQKMSELLSNEDLQGYELDNEILKIILNFEQVESIAIKDRNEIVLMIREALEKEGTFQNRFTLNGIEFGIIPNFDKITGGEYTDLIKYADDIQDYHKFIAVCYRPITNQDRYNNYLIESYEGTSTYAETMKDLPMSIANGVKVFFWNLTKDLEKHTQTFMEEEQVRGLKHQTTSKNGGFTQRFTAWVKGIYSK